jgi:hypothetical protein
VQHADARLGNGAACTLVPAQAARQALLYVLSSAPHTGLSSLVQLQAGLGGGTALQEPCRATDAPEHAAMHGLL